MLFGAMRLSQRLSMSGLGARRISESASPSRVNSAASPRVALHSAARTTEQRPPASRLSLSLRLSLARIDAGARTPRPPARPDAATAARRRAALINARPLGSRGEAREAREAIERWRINRRRH